MFRQGDILFIRVQQAPHSKGKVVERENGRIVVAEGEVTGHSHAITTPDVEMYEKANIRWLVAPQEFVVSHEEHEAIKMPPGVWRVVYQREYAPERPPYRVLD